MLKELKRNRQLYLMCLPALLLLLFLAYIPMVGIWMAFTKYNVQDGIFGSEFIGLHWFKHFFTNSTGMGLKVIRNTLVINFWGLIFGTAIPITIAICFNEIGGKLFKKVTQSAMFFPYFLSWVVASYFVYAFLSPTSGLIPSMQKSMGVAKVFDWYNNPGPWPVILVICNIWKNTGYSTVLYLSAITGIDATQYEAASIDGASKWQQIRYITIPHLKTMILILFIMNVGKIFNADFGLFYQVPMDAGLLTSATQVIDTYVYRAMLATGSVGMSTAAGLAQNVLGFICIMTANTIVKKIDSDSALF